MLRKLFTPFILALLAGSLMTLSEGCKTGTKKGCGCGADLNRIYKPSRQRQHY
jgi:hypothetical protein